MLTHGTTTAICDPHEICNVLGVAGLRYFLDSALGTAMDLRVQLSSCVPATQLETSGARLGAADLVAYRDHPKVIGLAEFMNVPGVLNKDPECLDKLAAFQGAHIDGHAPLLSGRSLNAYLACGVRNCHETTGLEEGREKLSKGMQVLIREGTASQDLAALVPLIDRVHFAVSRLLHRRPQPLGHPRGRAHRLSGAAGDRARRAAAVYRTASWSAARGFGLRDRGLVAPGYLADILLLDDLASCAVHLVLRRGDRLRQTFDDRGPTAAGRQFGAAAARDRTNLRSSRTRPIHAGDRHHSGQDPYRASGD